jgi:iron complex outermembrane receptor protein
MINKVRENLEREMIRSTDALGARRKLSRMALSAAPMLAMTFTCHAADQSQDSSSATQSEETPAPLATIPVSIATPEPVTETSADSDVRRIEEIVVTATKREESVRDLPQSITAISGEKLEDTGRINLVDYMQQTPGVTVNQAYPGLTRVTVRGISTETNPGSLTPSPVGFFVGDTAFTDPYLASIIPDLSAFDLAGVQVLKGPQGTLFGGAALSGAIRYELQQPVQGEWQVRGFAQTVQPEQGSLAITSGAAVNVPLLTDEQLALRVGYVRRNYSGIIDDDFSGDKDVNKGGGDQYRAILLWEPEDWRFELTHLQQDYKSPDALAYVDSPSGRRETAARVSDNVVTNKFGMDSFELGRNFDSFKLVALTSYLSKDADQMIDLTSAIVGEPPRGYPALLAASSPTYEYSKAWSQEVRLQSSDDGPFEWLVGAYYYHYQMDFGTSASLNATQDLVGDQSVLQQIADQLNLPISGLTENLSLINGVSHSKSSEKALFGDFTYKLWDSVKLSAGARFYQTAVNGGFTGDGVLVLVENNGMPADSRAKLTERGINPKFTATWKFTEDMSVYAQAAKGYRFGGLQTTPSTATNGVPPIFKSDTLWNYELGLRTSWLDRTLDADLTAFYIRYNNPIVAQSTQGIPLGYSDNVSGAVSKGLEASLLWYTPINGLNLSLTGALTDARITTPFDASGNVEVKAGQELPGAAPTQYNATIQYLRPFGIFTVGANTGYNYVGQGYNDIVHSMKINGYGSWDAGLIFSTDAWWVRPKLAVNVSNLLDKSAPVGGMIVKPLLSPVAATFNQYILNQPRTIIARLSLDF